jgi:hypothetical protein
VGHRRQHRQDVQGRDTFYEPTGCLHRVSRNPSQKGKTRILAVVLHPAEVKDIVIPEKVYYTRVTHADTHEKQRKTASRHTNAEFVVFLQALFASVEPGWDIQIADNFSTRRPRPSKLS